MKPAIRKGSFREKVFREVRFHACSIISLHVRWRRHQSETCAKVRCILIVQKQWNLFIHFFTKTCTDLICNRSRSNLNLYVITYVLLKTKTWLFSPYILYRPYHKIGVRIIFRWRPLHSPRFSFFPKSLHAPIAEMCQRVRMSDFISTSLAAAILVVYTWFTYNIFMSAHYKGQVQQTWYASSFLT